MATDMRVTVRAPVRRSPTYSLVLAAPLAGPDDAIDMVIAADAALDLGWEYDVFGDLIDCGHTTSRSVRVWADDTPELIELLAATGDNNINPSGSNARSLVVPAANPYRWAIGWQFLPERCVGGGRQPVECIGDTGQITADANPGIVVGDPFLVWAGDTCSTFGWQARDFKGRAQSLLAGSQSYEIANEVWTGSLSLANGLANVALSDSVNGDVMTAAPVDAATGLALVEQGLATRLQGSKGMIHVTPQVLSQLVTNGHIRREGNLWLSPMDHIVVGDAGYDGSGPGGVPAGTTQWMYGTSMIYLYLGPVQLFPDTLSEALDRSINKITYLAERIVGFKWDHCGLVSAELSVPVGDVDANAPGS